MANDKLIERMDSLEKLLKKFLDTVDRLRKEDKLAKNIEEFTLENNMDFLLKYHSEKGEEESLKGFG